MVSQFLQIVPCPEQNDNQIQYALFFHGRRDWLQCAVLLDCHNTSAWEICILSSCREVDV
jgi:hypothetical protein